MAEVISIAKKQDDEWMLDLDDFEKALAKAKPFSGEKGHILALLMDTAKNQNLPKNVRHRACTIVWTYSEVRQFLSSQLMCCHQCDSENARWSAEAMKNWVVK
tara:strand:- start:2228 stop:2536 length:309 start_codon:yes stop_codon:yes gene_type:complete